MSRSIHSKCSANSFMAFLAVLLVFAPMLATAFSSQPSLPSLSLVASRSYGNGNGNGRRSNANIISIIHNPLSPTTQPLRPLLRQKRRGNQHQWSLYNSVSSTIDPLGLEPPQTLPSMLNNSSSTILASTTDSTLETTILNKEDVNSSLSTDLSRETTADSKDEPTTSTPTSTSISFFRRIDGIVFLAYLCNVMALSLPVILVPIAATEQAATTMVLAASAGASSTVGTATTAALVAAQVASISSIASLGGATGKFINGFICKEYGSYSCSKLYLMGLGLCSLVFSVSGVSPSSMGLAVGGMEFFASIQWASLAVMLSNYYATSPVKLAAALTAMGLSSTGGQIMAKVFGMTLSTAFHWRQVARVGACVAFIGAALISRAPGREAAALQQQTKPNFQWTSVTESLKAVLGSKLFLVLGLCHAMAFVARGTDRILGTFFSQMAGLPQSICGGMTLSITLGLVHGLISGGKKYAKCEDLSQKRSFLKKRYITSVLATTGLIGLSQIGAAGLIPNKIVMSSLVALLSGVMASNIAFQYFQFPAMIAQRFGEHKPVVISFLDGFGFLMSAPIFATIGCIVPSLGWSFGWALLATLFGSAAMLMLTAIDPILNLAKTPAEEAKEAAAAM